jgi:hypothetical protein
MINTLNLIKEALDQTPMILEGEMRLFHMVLEAMPQKSPLP